jgi:tRNA guanosine-2'-O-methyltransferase
MRALQALCVLSRFVTPDIAELVCRGAFEAMGRQNAHNQLRYFVEIFTLQCSRKHPAVFGKALVEQITRTDLSLQMVASLMIISGNLIVGRYEKDFFRQYGREGSVNLHAILAGIIPWLSSTQGFTRAISQLLTYKLIPMVIDVNANAPEEDSNWYLQSIYHFLDENPEMKRLRKKQAKFFERYEVDPVCTVEGVLAIPVDESSESNPVHLVDVIKECLHEVYEEGNIDRAPIWRQIEVARASSTSTTDDQPIAINGDGDAVNFQRKIIPLDALNLALEGMREQRLRNVAGRRRQNLIVCASLIDKVPNLGGLARTAEIFAADRLIVPDILVTKMDNFKSLCVGAGDWIEIEECREQVRCMRMSHGCGNSYCLAATRYCCVE